MTEKPRPEPSREDRLLRIAALVNGYHNDGTTLSAAETLAEIAKVLGDPFAAPPDAASDHAPDEQLFRRRLDLPRSEPSREWTPEVWDEALDDLAREIWSVLCEGEGTHSEQLDRNIIKAHVREFLRQTAREKADVKIPTERVLTLEVKRLLDTERLNWIPDATIDWEHPYAAPPDTASALVELIAKWRERQHLNEVNSEYDYEGASNLCATLSGRAQAQKECADELEAALRAAREGK